MSIFKYIKDSYRPILYFFLMILLIDLILISSTDLSKSLLDIFYMNLLLFTISIIFLIVSYAKWRNTFKDLKRAIELEKNIDSFIPEGKKLEQVLIRDIIELKNKEKLKETEELKDNLAEINDYITKWVHQIKTPLTVCELISDRIEEKGHYDLSKELRQELERINFLVNQVLHISRASSYSSDLIVEEINLGYVVKSVIKNNMNSLIAKGIELEIDNLDFNIFSDGKWVYYVIDQIVNNACKYVEHNGKIEIRGQETDESIILSIKDNGMGIPAKDIDRIFDRGFTGENGRKIGKSTGMGLYICKKIAEKLNFDIEVSSQVGKYTEFRIHFYKLSDYLKVTKM